MSLRSWAIRGLILAGVAAIVALIWLANSWVSPERVRTQVIANLSEQFEDVDVHVGSARLRILGGIAVTDLKLTRRGSSGNSPFLVVPSAILYHDKEQLNRGRLVIKKVELENPELHLERSPDGKWNVAEVVKQGPADKPVPTFVIKGGTIHVIDCGSDPLPAITLTDAQLTLLNDPLPVLAIQARAATRGFGPVIARARVNRITGGMQLGLELPEFPLGKMAVGTADRFVPGLGQHLAGLSATAAITADLTYAPDTARKWRHDVRVDLKDARFTHPDLPWPVEQIAAALRVVDGRVKVDDATAEVAGAHVKLTLETRVDENSKLETRNTESGDVLKRLENHLQRLELSVSGVTLDDALFNNLPERAKAIRQQFAPVGQVDLGYKFTREATGWRRDVELRPKQIAATYEKFKYTVRDLRGWVKRTVTHVGEPTTGIDLIGIAGGQMITVKGQIVGEGPDPGINLRVTGANVPIDETLFAAFPTKYSELVRRFRASGRGDFVAEIVQQPGVNLCENEFRIDVRDATLNHVELPYPLEKVKGRLVVRVAATDSARPLRPGDTSGSPPDRDEIILDGFTAIHGGAAVWVNGSKRPIPGSRDRKLTLHVGGNNCPVDGDLKATFGALKVDSIWAKFEPRGKLSFAADVELIDRAAPLNRPDVEPPINPVTDLKLTFNFSGPTVTPSFFPYEMADFTGWVEYKNGRLDVAHVAGRHGESRVKLAAAEIRFYPDGVVWANLGAIEIKPLIADEAFLKALPGKLGPGLEELQLKGGAELLVKHLVILTPPDPLTNNVPPPDPFPIGAMPGAGRMGSAVDELWSLSSSRRVVARGQSPGFSPIVPQPDPVAYWDVEIKLTRASVDTGVAWEEVFGGIACRGRYEGTHAGLVRGAIWLDRAVIAKQPVTRLAGRVRAAPQQIDPARSGHFLPTELEFTDLTGNLFHGVLGGEARVVLTSPVRFDLWLTATDVQLDEVAKHYKLGSDADLKGIAQGQLHLYNRPDPKNGRLVLGGEGQIHVPMGRMYNLPILLDLVKVLRLQAPDKTAFEEANAVFRIQGDRVKVEQIDLIGKAVCLGGSGELDTSGEFVKFEFYTIVSQVLARLINTPVGDLTAFLSKNLTVIKLNREGGELKYKVVPVPLVTEPIRSVADRLRARAAQMFGGK